MAYTVPQVRVFQELADAATSTTNTRAAHVTGPHAELFRYAIADEKLLASIGAYAAGASSTRAWPNRSPGATVDQGYVRVFADDALALYYSNVIGSGAVVAPVSGYPNRVRDAGTIFADNGTYLKSSTMGDRGAKVGDTVYVRGVVSSVTYELTTTIRSFVGEAIAATVGAASALSTNQAATTFATSVDSLNDLDNAITLTLNGSGYDGLADGVIDETYTIEVTQSSAGGDLTTARLRVTSASGLDDAVDVVPAGVGGYTAIGSRGLLGEFDANLTVSASSAAGDDDIAVADLVAGMRFRARVVQAFTPATVASGGAYVGLENTTYLIEVTKGGLFADSPEVSVTTTTGYDSEGPLVVTASAATFPVGGYGVLAALTGAALRKGDKYRIDVTGATQGALRTIVLTDDLPTEIQTATDLDLKLYIKTDLEIARFKPSDNSLSNWTPEETQIIFDSAIEAVLTEWTVSGSASPLPIESADLYTEYRAWIETYVGKIESLTDVSEVPGVLGPVTPDNPLAFGVYMALANSGGTPVYFTAVPTPEDTDSWLSALEALEGVDGIYNLVPLSDNSLIQDAWKAHVIAQSSPEVGNWRATVLATNIDVTGPVVDATNSSDLGVVLATLADNPNASGTQYTRLSVPAGNAKFQTNGVRAGDTVRYLYGTDGNGNELYTEFIIDEVVSEGTLLLLEGHSVAVPVASKIEVWRIYSPSDLATRLAAQVARYGDKRVVCVANPTLTGGGFEFPGYFGAAAVAGLRSGSLPHRPLTNVTLTGIDGMGTVASRLSGTQLNSVAEVGGWWIYRDRAGSVFNRHGITTDTSVIANREESLRSNFDNVSYTYRAAYLPYIGQVTITDDLLQELGYVFRNVTTALTGEKYGNLGPQLISAETPQFRQHPIERDRVVVNVTITMPAPLNNLDLHLKLVI